MTIGQANCLICGEPIVYWNEAREVTCVVCGKVETGHCVCEAGHYVCDSCHRSEGVDHIIKVCLASKSTNPITIMNKAMSDKSVYPNGPEHHTLVGAALITAYANAGGTISNGWTKEQALAELKNRSLQVPGGTCGFWGVCGASTSVGQALSIINGSSPMTQEPWAQCQKLTSLVLGRLAELGGPRCCKRVGYVALVTAVPYINELMGVNMQLPEKIVCTFFSRNAECRRNECPWFPNADPEVAAAFQPGAAKK